MLWSVNEVCDLSSDDNIDNAISVPRDFYESSTESEFCRYSENEDQFVGGQTYTTLPVYAMGLSITYLDIHCGLNGTLKTATYTVVPVHRPWCCDMV